jgi:hypothetical protein
MLKLVRSNKCSCSFKFVRFLRKTSLCKKIIIIFLNFLRIEEPTTTEDKHATITWIFKETKICKNIFFVWLVRLILIEQMFAHFNRKQIKIKHWGLDSRERIDMFKNRYQCVESCWHFIRQFRVKMSWQFGSTVEKKSMFQKDDSFDENHSRSWIDTDKSRDLQA